MTSNYAPPTNGDRPDMLPREVDPSAPLADRVAQARAMVERRDAGPQIREPRPEELPDGGIVGMTEKYRAEFIAAPWSRDSSWESATTAYAAMGVAADAIRDAVDTADAIIGDRTTWPGFRFEKYAENLTATDEAVREALDEAETALTVAEATAITEAMPKVDKVDKQAADARAARMLGSIKNRAEMAGLLNTLAARDDAVGALVTDGGWMNDYLLGAGYDAQHREALCKQATLVALAAAESSGDTKRASAARAVKAVKAGRQGLIALRTGWNVARPRLASRAEREIPHVQTVSRISR
ncbi:hypothetical protein OG836_26165 [Micromonospora zamorensis]|uniref:hypothetical protein n=1 Tax=Micromonospora zamorensis TaxID=709883 RepID=UPI002E2365E9